MNNINQSSLMVIENKGSFEILEIESSQESVFLIAIAHQHKLTNSCGYLLYKSDTITGWNSRDHVPLVNTILFATVEEAFQVGKEILRTSSDLKQETILKDTNEDRIYERTESSS